MPVVEETVFIGRPPQEVFDFIVNAENLPVWDVSVVEAEQLDDASPGVGGVGRKLNVVSRHELLAARIRPCRLPRG